MRDIDDSVAREAYLEREAQGDFDDHRPADDEPIQPTFCQICRHESPGHKENCPVLTGEPQAGSDLPAEFWQQFPQGPQNQAMQVSAGTLAQLRARK